MADDRMKNDDLDKNLGRSGQQQDEYGQQAPGRSPLDDRSTGQRDTGQNEPKHGEEDFGAGEGATKKPGGGMNR